MKSLLRISSIFIALAVVFGSNNNVSSTETANENSAKYITNNNQSSDIQQIIAPTDLKRIKKIRFEKARVEKIKSKSVLNTHRNKDLVRDSAPNPNIELIGEDAIVNRKMQEMKGQNIFSDFSSKIEEKYLIRNVKNSSEKSAIKFPTKNESK